MNNWLEKSQSWGTPRSLVWLKLQESWEKLKTDTHTPPERKRERQIKMHPTVYNPKIEAGKIASEARWGKGSMREMWKVRGDVERNTCWTLKTRVKSKKGKETRINQSNHRVVGVWWNVGITWRLFRSENLIPPLSFKFNIALNNTNGPCVCGYILSSMAESHLLDNIEIQVNANLTPLPLLLFCSTMILGW